MIGLSRLKRAIEDLPTGGMQTGDPKVRLKLCDAQRLEVEFNAIIAERDNAFAQNEQPNPVTTTSYRRLRAGSPAQANQANRRLAHKGRFGDDGCIAGYANRE
jgi:hypothetical protein